MVRAVLYSTFSSPKSASSPKERALPMLTRSKKASRYRKMMKGMMCRSILRTMAASVVPSGGERAVAVVGEFGPMSYEMRPASAPLSELLNPEGS